MVRLKLFAEAGNQFDCFSPSVVLLKLSCLKSLSMKISLLLVIQYFETLVWIERRLGRAEHGRAPSLRRAGYGQ